MSNETGKKKCEICGSEENVEHYIGGPLAFICQKCDKIITRYNYSYFLYRQSWCGMLPEDIAEMKEFANHNRPRVNEMEDISMDVLIGERADEEEGKSPNTDDIRIRRVGSLGDRALAKAKDMGLKDEDLVILTTKFINGFPIYEIEKIEGSPTEYLLGKYCKPKR